MRMSQRKWDRPSSRTAGAYTVRQPVGRGASDPLGRPAAESSETLQHFRDHKLRRAVDVVAGRPRGHQRDEVIAEVGIVKLAP